MRLLSHVAASQTREAIWSRLRREGWKQTIRSGMAALGQFEVVPARHDGGLAARWKHARQVQLWRLEVAGPDERLHAKKWRR